MGVGTLIYSNGLKGSQPVFINQGNATSLIIGEPDVPQIKKIQSTGATIGAANFILSEINNKIKLINITTADSASYSTYSSSAYLYTINGSTVVSTSTISPNGVYGKVRGYYFLGSVGSFAVSPVDTAGYFAYDLTTEYTKNNILFDKNNTPSSITIKVGSEDLSNPINFSSWGNEFSTTNYSGTKSYNDDTYYDVVAGSNYIVVKVTNVPTNTEGLIPLYKTRLYNGNFQTYVWNGTSWSNNHNAEIGNYGIGGLWGDLGPIPYGNYIAGSSCINSNTVYYKMTLPVSSRIGYLGLLAYNKFINSQ